MADVVVSTECPTCGAPLDFAEGTTAVRCGHCRSNLLVTGRKRVMSYVVPPALTEGPAISRVKLALGEASGRARIGDVRLRFVPYYRFAGHEFRWEEPAPPSPPPHELLQWMDDMDPAHDRDDDIGQTLAWAAGLVASLLGAPTVTGVAPVTAERRQESPLSSGPATATGTVPRADRAPVPPQLHDRYVDRSFLGADLPGFGVTSLGVRTSVVKLRLFEPQALGELGQAVPLEVPADSAVAVGMEPPDAGHILHRTVIGRSLSVIYFPFWLVPFEADGRARLAIVDAVGDRVVSLDAPAALAERLERRQEGQPDVIGFRPLVCPNCGWDLPVRPVDAVFYCGSCEHAWQVRGTDLEPVPSEIAGIAGEAAAPEARYLPCWVLDDGGDTARARRFFSPAFRFQRLKFLADLARKLSAAQPRWEAVTGRKVELVGCYYDVEDAVLLARFTEAGLTVAGGGSTAPAGPPPISAARLTWFPFRRAPLAWIDPFTGLALPQNLLI